MTGSVALQLQVEPGVDPLSMLLQVALAVIDASIAQVVHVEVHFDVEAQKDKAREVSNLITGGNFV